jgi:hypothetical protein
MSQCHWAKSLGELEATHQEAWGTTDYESRHFPTVFFGLYDLRDYLALSVHKGKCWVLWAGGDIENLIHGFTLNDGKLKWLGKFLPLNWWLKGMLRKAEHWVEDEDEAEKLKMFLPSKKINICPSFLGKIDYWSDPIREYYHKQKPDVYVSCGKDRQWEYGFDTVERIAGKCNVVFHLYGDDWMTGHDNVIVHGRVSKEQFNKDIRHYQCGLRLNEHDGFSEITAKSVLMGQYPITRLRFEMIPQYNNDRELIEYLNSLRGCTQPNRKGRKYYLETLNRYPWNDKINKEAH